MTQSNLLSSLRSEDASTRRDQGLAYAVLQHFRNYVDLGGLDPAAAILLVLSEFNDKFVYDLHYAYREFPEDLNEIEYVAKFFRQLTPNGKIPESYNELKDFDYDPMKTS